MTANDERPPRQGNPDDAVGPATGQSAEQRIKLFRRRVAAGCYLATEVAREVARRILGSGEL